MNAGRRGIIFLAGVLISAAVAAGEASHRPGVFWPHAGVVCDPSAGFCAGTGGMSPWLTGRYLGQAARDALEERSVRGGRV
ncbi:hypothetical protein DEO48_25615 [Enterobacter sp. CGMCC 5087]|uniref:YcgJ family protein n=1 Tax=Enterobacter sp. CGMCC 5087 TaxID=2183878 RepID=UPI000D676034|nr:hypothetical protein DEO48_25615 [Enterobacter sp. CGMCC 5087]